VSILEYHDMKREQNSGFSLVELLAVTAIIAILIGMIGIAAHSARQRAYTAMALTEVQQLSTALKTYWMAEGKWPDGMTVNSDIKLSEDLLVGSGLLGGGAGGVVYLEVPPDRFEFSSEGTEKYYLDPWGMPYRVTLKGAVDIQTAETFQVVVRFINSDAYYYQDM